ncbi:MAG: periplasmic heavy metal sensor [Roseomonas sp.]|nr:periplasmic heavy metal sensor [Roseomonas sp.]
MRFRKVFFACLLSASLAGNAFVLANLAAHWVAKESRFGRGGPPIPAERMAAVVGAEDARLLRTGWQVWAEEFATRRAALDRAQAEVLQEFRRNTPDATRLADAFASMREAEARMEAIAHSFVVSVAPSLSVEGRTRIAGLRPPRS